MVEVVLHDNGMDDETAFSNNSNRIIESKSSELITEAVILAGGLGKRLFPLTKNRPKPLVPICNNSMIDWNFSLLASNGIKRAIVVVGYLGEQIRNHIEKVTSKNFPDLDIIIPKVESNGTADALRAVNNYVTSKNFFVTMADIVTNFNLKKMATYHFRKEGIATISLKELNTNPSHFGLIILNDRGKVINFLEKPSPQELYLTYLVLSKNKHVHLQSNLINSGIYCFKNTMLDVLNDNENLKDFGHEVFPFLLQQKYGLYGYKSEEDYFWRDCGQFGSLLKTNLEVLERKTMPYCPKGKEKDGCWYDDNCLYNKALINKPVAIGKNVKIESDTTIHLASINDNCNIGKNCMIEKSLIWENATIGDQVKIVDSIISDGVKIGNNCIVEKGSIIPEGFKIPPNSHIRAGNLIA